MDKETTDTPTTEKDQQDQVFGHRAEELKEDAARSPRSTDDSRRPEPHAGGKA